MQNPPRIMCLLAIMLIGSTTSAEIVTRSIEYSHGDMVLEGYLAYDTSLDGRQPGVLVVHEWWGQNEFARDKARELAALGYVAFALDMYGKGIVTDQPSRASELARPFYSGDFSLMRARARAGLDVLSKQANVDPDRIASIGFCFGGTVSLQLAYSGAPVAGVVSFHGALPPPREDDQDGKRAKILVLHGADDPLVPEEQVASFKQGVRQAGADWQLIAYGGAVHSFTNPGADDHGIPGVAYDEAAHRRSWRHMRVFFDEIFRD